MNRLQMIKREIERLKDEMNITNAKIASLEDHRAGISLELAVRIGEFNELAYKERKEELII